MRLTQKNFLIGCCFAAAGLIMAWVIVPAQVSTTKNVVDFQPTFFPLFACYLIVFLSAILMISNLVKDRQLLKDLIPNLKSVFNKEAFKTARNVIIVFAVFCVYLALFNWVGFIISTAIVLPLLMFIMGWRKPVTAIICTAVVIVVLYWFFNQVMMLTLP